MKKIIRLAVLTLMLGCMHLAHALSPGEAYIQAGTQGIGIGYALPINDWLGVRADLNGFSLSHNFTASSTRYKATINLTTLGAYADLFPVRDSGFRASLGLIFNNDYLSGNSQPNADGTITVHGVKVPVGTLDANVHAKVKYPSILPYVGVGYGHAPSAKGGLGFTADLGVAYGDTSVEFNPSQSVIDAVGQKHIDAARQILKDKANNYNWYPIIQVGLTYRF